MIKEILEYVCNEYIGQVDYDFVDYLMEHYEVADKSVAELYALVHNNYEEYVRGL